MAKATHPRTSPTVQGRLPLGRSFLRTLRSGFDTARFSRGREIFEHQRVLMAEWASGQVSSRIKGRPKPYRDLGGCPVYEAWMRFEPLPEAEVLPVLVEIGSRVGLAAQLLSHDLCWREDDLLPTGFESGCSCPDARNPCKHIAALTHHLARCLDRDPLILFELRGIAREEIERHLFETPLGGVVLEALRHPLPRPEMREYFFTRPQECAIPQTLSPADFFGGPSVRRESQGPQGLGIPGILVRKGGDYPRFWEGDESFIKVMDAFYAELRRRLTEVL
jgi:uncharacterized Zn finger protein